MQRYFITGTDTDCGKTYIVCQLLDYLRKQGFRAQALKPVASGVTIVKNQKINSDIALLEQHNYVQTQSINLHLYDLPISPHLAAEKAGEQIRITEIAQFCEAAENNLDYQLIEGAGGLLVPLNRTETWLDFLEKTQLSLILVVGIRLGCINHALLTDAVLKHAKIPCAGWIANCLDDETLFIDEIISTLQYKMHMPFLTNVKYCGIINEIKI